MDGTETIMTWIGIVAYIVLVVGLLWRHITMTEKVRKFDWMVYRLSEELRDRGFEVFVDVEESFLSCVVVTPPKQVEWPEDWLAEMREILGEEVTPVYNQQGERIYPLRDDS